MITAEDRHIPKTKITQRYNSFTKRWEKEKAPSGAPTYDQHSTVSQSRMPRSIGQAPGEGKTIFRIPGGEFKDEDRGISGNPAVRMEDTLTPQRRRNMQQQLTQAERQANSDVRQPKDPLSYGMPSENPSAKIPAEPGQSGSSGVYRIQTGRLSLDDMEQILGSVYSEKQTCGCSHPCQEPCSCSTKEEKAYLFKGTVRQYDKILEAPEHVLRQNGLTRESVLRARELRLELDATRKKWEADSEGQFVDKEFGLSSLAMPEMKESIARDCVCPNRTDKTIQCSCLVRRGK